MCKNVLADRIETHSHLDTSNIRLLDCTNTAQALLEKSIELGLKGIAVTDHETVSAHVKVMQLRDKMKKEGKMPEDFKVIFGNEIYLIDSLEEVRDNYQGGGKTKFPHFILLAKNKKGHEALRKLSSQAWINSFYTGTMERVPTEKEFMYNLLSQEEYKGTLMATSACLGSESSIHILGMAENWNDYHMTPEQVENYEYHETRLKMFIEFNINLFGKENFYLELQPSPDYEQRTVNEKLVELSKEYNLKMVIANDVHYLRPEDREIHSAYLRSKEDERETDSFYAHTYLHTIEETFEKMSYINKEIIEDAFKTSLEIGEKCEDYTLEASTQIPISRLPEFEVQHIFANGYEQYKYINFMANSESEQDRYLVHCIEKGFQEKVPYHTFTKERFHEYIDRIDSELGQLWEMSVKLNAEIEDKSKHQHMSSYYVTTLKIVELIWGDDCGDDSLKEGSLLGAGRGSAVAFLINFLTGITLVNPMEYGIEIPYWRHLNHEQGSIASLDIDLDVTSTKKHYIFERMRKFYGNDNVIQVCTFGKEKPKSAINTACRGLGISLEDGQYIGSFIPFFRGEYYSISDCLYGNEKEGREPVPEFIREIEKFPGLKETALKIEGLINKRSTHAGGVMVYNNGYWDSNALMRSPNGDFVTQFNLDDSQATGGIKYDILTIEANDKIQTTIELMLEFGVIKWQGTLRKTFEKYLHPEVIDKTSPELFETLGSGRVPDLFQFSTALGQASIKKIKPSTLIEATAISSIIRLMTEGGGEQPADTFLRFKNDISLWYKEMEEYGLNEDEVKMFEKHLLHLNGVADSQESIMLMAMDRGIAGFDLMLATKLRKLISKKKKDEAIAFKDVIYEHVKKSGNRIEVANYLWLQISRMLLYSFSVPHALAYTLVGFEELNLFHHYNPIYWQTACLTVNSGSQQLEEGDKKKDKNYGKVAEAIGKMKNYGVDIALPDINKAGISFTPDADNNRIVYSLKGVAGMNDESSRIIIENRPYTSFKDFHERLYTNGLLGINEETGEEIRGKLLKKAQIINLIKAGAFNSFGDRVDIMKEFVFYEVDKKETLNMQNIKSIIRLGLLDSPEYNKYLEVMQLRDDLRKKKVDADTMLELSIRHKLTKSDCAYVISQKLYDQYQKLFPSNEALLEYSVKGILISDKKFDKEYKKFIEPLKKIIASPEFIKQFNIAQFYELWDTMAQGTVPKWEMDSVTYYSDKHELDGVDTEKYGISNYFDINPTPEIIETYTRGNREYQKYKIYTLVGTVLDRNKDKHTFSLLTPDGVVTCKTYAGAFSHYDKTISKVIGGTKKTLEKSWFTRGNLVMVKGFRREDQFVLRTNAVKGQEKEHTINLIWGIEEDGSLILQGERTKV